MLAETSCVEALEDSATEATEFMLSRMRSPRGGDLTDRRRDLLDAGAHVLDALADLQERLAGLLDRVDATLCLLGTDLDDLHRALRLVLDLLDQLGDGRSGLLGLLGEVTDLLGDDGEAAAVLAGAGSLDRGVERQQVRLRGDAGDRLDDPADLV